MTFGRTTPVLALDTCGRRLAAAGMSGTADITWHGPAGVPADHPGSEATIQARCGLMEVNGRDAGTPRRLGIEVASVAAGILAAQGAIAAGFAGLLRGGPAPAVQTSVLQAGLLLLSHYFVVATGLGDAVPGPPLPAPGPPFRSAEGHWFEIETLDAEPWQAFWTALGVPADPDLGRAWTMFRWRYERAACSLPPELHQATQRRPLEELRQVAAGAEVSLTPLRAYAAVLADPGTGVAHPVLRSVDGLPPAPFRPPPADASLPLAGVRVVEATSRIQGPFAGMLLRMLGADVIRIQPPEGDYGRAAQCLHRGKDAVRLDLGRRAGRAALVDLVDDADVFLHNWRPGKAAEWALEFDDLAPRRPGLVYANTSGWGDRPEARRMVGTDFLVQAYAGVGHGLHPEEEPAFPSRVILCDLFGGLVAAEGVVTGLYRRARGGHGCEVRSSLLAGAMAVQTHVLDAMALGKEDGRRGGRPVWGHLDRPVATADGGLMVGIEDDVGFERLCRRFDVEPAALPRAATEQRICARLAEGTASEWAERLAGDGIAASVVCDDLAGVPADPRLASLFEPAGGTCVAPRSPWIFGSSSVFGSGRAFG
jgi:CoA:oxalate CoA-transferase